MPVVPQIAALKGMSPLGIPKRYESPAMTAQATIKASVFKYTIQLCEVLTKDYERRYGNYRRRFHTSTGRKYHKILESEGSVHAFVDKNTGEVYKAASYKAPAKGARFDLRLIKDREWLFSHADWAGSYLYHNAYHRGD